MIKEKVLQKYLDLMDGWYSNKPEMSFSEYLAINKANRALPTYFKRRGYLDKDNNFLVKPTREIVTLCLRDAYNATMDASKRKGNKKNVVDKKDIQLILFRMKFGVPISEIKMPANFMKSLDYLGLTKGGIIQNTKLDITNELAEKVKVVMATKPWNGKEPATGVKGQIRKIFFDINELRESIKQIQTELGIIPIRNKDNTTLFQ